MSTIAEKLVTIAENQQRIYEKGKAEGGGGDSVRQMWEVIQVSGTRTNYNQSLMDYIAWTKKNFKPIYDINFTSMYMLTRNITHDINELRLQEGNINLIEYAAETGVNFTFACGGHWGYAFSGTAFSVIDTIDITQATSLDGLFYGGFTSGTKYADLLPKRVEHLICSEANAFNNNSFQYQNTIEHIGFEGVIAKNGLNLSWSNKLDKESLLKLIDTLKNFNVAQGSSDTADTYEMSQTLVPNIVPKSVTIPISSPYYDGNVTDNGEGLFIVNDETIATIDYTTGVVSIASVGFIASKSTITYEYYSPSGITCTATLGATNLAKLTDAEIAIATQKGWTLG